jgi:hypothetical protein
MQCPKCQAEFEDLHFYCPVCRTLISEYANDQERSRRGKLEEAGARLLNVFAGAFILGALVLMARAVEWNEFFTLLKREFGSVVEETSKPEVERAPRTAAQTNRRPAVSSSPAKINEPVRLERTPGIESVRALPQKIESLSPDDEPAQQVSNQEKPVTPANVETNQPANIQASTSEPKPPEQPTVDEVKLGIEQIDGAKTGTTGVLVINSYTPARIYINGQYSGTTPRTIKLTAGDHQLRLIADGYEEWTRRVRMTSRQQVGIMASMKKINPQ